MSIKGKIGGVLIGYFVAATGLGTQSEGLCLDVDNKYKSIKSYDIATLGGLENVASSVLYIAPVKLGCTIH